MSEGDIPDPTQPKPLHFQPAVSSNCCETSHPAFPSIGLSITSPIIPLTYFPSLFFLTQHFSRRYYPPVLFHLPHSLPLVSSFIFHNHLTIHQFTCQRHHLPSLRPPLTWYLPAVADPAQCGGRLAAWRHAAELHLATLHRCLLHLHHRCLGRHLDGERCHLVVGGVSVELTEVAALIEHADVGQRDVHQARREEHHLEAVVLQR